MAALMNLLPLAPPASREHVQRLAWLRQEARDLLLARCPPSSRHSMGCTPHLLLPGAAAALPRGRTLVPIPWCKSGRSVCLCSELLTIVLLLLDTCAPLSRYPHPRTHAPTYPRSHAPTHTPHTQVARALLLSEAPLQTASLLTNLAPEESAKLVAKYGAVLDSPTNDNAGRAHQSVLRTRT